MLGYVPDSLVCNIILFYIIWYYIMLYYNITIIMLHNFVIYGIIYALLYYIIIIFYAIFYQVIKKQKAETLTYINFTQVAA